MAKQLNINLGFTADINQAQANIQALQRSLNQISSIKPIGGGMLTKDMQLAVNSAKSLEQHLTNAFNMKTGNFDLSKLSLSLRQSGESLSGLSAGLLRAGENGERAFMNVQKALTTANVQINKSNGMLAQFANTLKNTARWQLSSSLLHGFISGLNQAISYSKDLDKSLNNIRIVTGYSAEDMQDFARSANEAAKALSSTTNEYAKASLIYFQQGLGADEVKERTDATIKMANVSGQSAETVSDQMTAVWNNFDDGSKSLEYYADVMVKLGAETASSSDEIAGGLEKFAAVGKTIGLSYEYAAAALATITARTRQSEEVVGTALKTIFARIQGLKLGETLEDGVELNKYSEALQSVGISIFEQNGELKQMDSILSEMGAKWETLSKAQQVALAQTVAGVRQYTQLIALMDSWNDGEGSFQDNLQTAYDATGALDKQQKTYEESWQAASKRIRASLEGIWEDLIPSDSIIGITDVLAGLLNIVDRLVEGFGGLEGIIMLVATIAINKMGPSLANGIDLAILKAQEFKQQLADQNLLSFGGIAQTIKTNFMNMFTPAATSAAQLRDNVQAVKYETDSLEKGMAFYNEHLKSGASATTQMLQNMNAETAAQDNLSSSFKQYLADTTQINNLQAMIEANKRKMTQADLDSLSALQSAATAAAERKAIEQETLELIQLQIDRQKMQIDNNLYDSANYMEDNTSSMMLIDNPNTALTQAQSYTDGLDGAEFWKRQIEQVIALKLEINQLSEGILLVGESTNAIGEASITAREMFADMHSLNLQLNEVLKNGNISIEERQKEMQKIIADALRDEKITANVAEQYSKVVNKLHEVNKPTKTFSNFTSRITNGIRTMAKGLGNTEKSLSKAAKLREDEFDAQQKTNQATSQHKNLIDQIANGLNKGLSGLSTWGGQISKTISGFSRLAMAANMVKNAIETLNDPDADFTSKLVSSTMALSMGFSALIPVIQGITNGIRSYKMAQGGLIATTTTYAAINKALATDSAKTVMIEFLKEASSKKLTAARKEEIAAEYAAKLAKKANISQDSARLILDELLVEKSKAKKGATDAETVANWANFKSQLAKHWILLLVVAALALIAAATWAVVAAVKADNEAAKENAKTMSELNEKTKELADSTQSLEGEIKSLIDTFNQQRAAGEDVSDTYNELVKKLNEVKQNYKKLNVSDSTMALLEQAEALGLATGNWEAYKKAQAQAQKEVKDEVGKQAEATTQANLKGAVAAFTDGQGDYEEDSGEKYVRRHVGNAGEDKEVSEILNKSEYAEIFKDINDDDATLRIDWDNESEFMEDYQLLANALRDMEIAGQTSNGTYQELKKEFDAMAEYAGEIEANMNAATEHRFQDKMNDLGLKAENINTVEEYTYVLETLTDEMTNFFTSSEEARKKAKAFLGTFGNTAESAAAYNFVEKFGNQMKRAVNYKGVAGTQRTLSTNDQGVAVATAGTNPTIEVEAKYNEAQIQQEVKAMFDYISGLPEEMRKVAMGIDLENIDNLQEFKTVFEKTQAFEAKVRIQADPQSVIESAKQIRDDLSDAMEDFSKQGYLTTTQAIDFLDEFPQYSHYLMETANGYAFTEEAIKEFNGALEDEKKALSELINPTNIGAKELSNFGKELIALEAAVEGEGLKKFTTDMQDLTTQFIEGKIKADEYFTSLNDNISNLNFDENTSINDAMAFGNEVVPTMVNGIDSYLGAIDAAFEKGQIGAIEYRKALTQSANAVLKLEQKTREAVKSTEKFSGIKFNEQTQQYERSAKWLGKVDQKTKDVVDSMNESLKRSKELEKVLKNMADFEGINVAATEDYDDLQKIFDEDFTIEIDSSQLDDAITKTQDYRDAIHKAFSAMDEASQKNITQLLSDTADKMYAVGTASYTMSEQGQQAFQNLGNKAVQSDNVVYQAAVNMLNGTYDASTESTELTASAMGLILASGADTSQMVAQMTNDVIQGIGDLVSNFDATIEIRAGGLGVDWAPYTFDIFGKEFTINLPLPHFDIGFKGKLSSGTQNTLNDIIGNLQGINTLTSGKSGGGMSSFAPAQSLGVPGDVQLDEDPDTGGGKGGKGGGGGGGSKSKTPQAQKSPEHKKKSDELERYYEIDNAIEDQTNLLEELAIAKDEAWGADKLKAMQDEIKASKEELALGEERLRQIDEWLEKDKTKVASYGITFDEDGRINNLDEVWTQQEEKWHQGQLEIQRREHAYEEAKNADENYDADGSIKLANEEYAKQIDDDYDEFMKAVEQYDNTLSEQAKQRLDNLQKELEIKQQNYEELEYKIELKVELNENDIEDIEHQLERLGDNNVYASAERIALIEKNAASYRNIADIQMAAIKEAERLYAADKISQEDYMARLQESKEALQDAEMSIRDGIAQIGDELENTFDLVDEKLDQQFTKFDQMIELMDHYKNIVSLTEGEASYKEFNKILKASQEVLRDRIAADESEVAMWTARREHLEADMKGMDKNSPEYLAAEEALNNIMEKEADAKSQLMADIEQLGEYAREIFENSIEQAIKDFEQNLLNDVEDEYLTLNSIIESIEMMNSRQEELLTTTNKIYETNKLIRNVEKDIEATTNNRAKQAYLEFQNKIKQKQEQNELTKFELDLLTAEYEMTKAQIALEEAQNAKDTVRLTRDAEGNYGYVYTANEDKVSDAEQALDDATNNYYNTALEGAQKYQDQIYQHIQEWEEKVKEVYLDQTLSEEEKNKKIKEINDTYNTLITQDKELFYIAKAAMEETSYQHQADYDLRGIKSAEKWFTESDGYLNDLKLAQNEYDIATGEVKRHTEENFGYMSDAIDNTTKKSEGLRDEITKSGGLADVLDNVLKKSIDNATTSWLNQIAALKEVIRLTDEAMKKNSDEKYYGTIDDFSQEIYDKISSGEYDINDPEIQALIERRWKKMGGEDNYDYTAMMNATDDPIWDSVYNTLREYKIANTNWMAKIQEAIKSGKKLSDIQWMIDIRDEKQKKLGQTPDSLEQAKKYAETIGATLATGGYTGSWGPEGKLAVLHEKELVLNAEDTKNFLSATNILREISQMLDRDALIASLGAINLRAMTLNSPADQVLQQEVTIHADFPNVTDHNEIEIAIDNLINAASQHAYRT